MINSKFRETILKKSIIIWGKGESGNAFFRKYDNIFKIGACTGNDKRNTIEGLNTIEQESICSKEEQIIVVCSQFYGDIAKQLLARNMEYGQDFINSELFDAIYLQKQIFVLVGQCELEIVKEILRNVDIISNKYYFYYCDEYKIFGIQEKRPLLESMKEVDFLITIADIFIYPVNITNPRKDYYERLRKKVKETCRILSVALTTFEAYWPQDNHSYYERSIHYICPVNENIQAWGRRDTNVEKFLENGINKESILNRIKDLDFYSKQEVERNFMITMKRWEILERNSDIKMSDYIVENYKKKLLYRDRGHMGKELYFELTKRIVRALKIEDAVCSKIDQTDFTFYNQCHNEFPIYPSVLRYLNQSAQKEKYFMIKRENSQYATFEEYMEQYIDYMMKVIELQEKW